MIAAPGQLNAITRACRRHRVARLHAFGSVRRPDDQPGESDIDLLVEFQPPVMADAIRNPTIQDSIEASKQKIDAA